MNVIHLVYCGKKKRIIDTGTGCPFFFKVILKNYGIFQAYEESIGNIMESECYVAIKTLQDSSTSLFPFQPYGCNCPELGVYHSHTCFYTFTKYRCVPKHK